MNRGRDRRGYRKQRCSESMIQMNETHHFIQWIYTNTKVIWGVGR